ncbi:MAG: hypothetical protein JWN27_1127 [Candidatus Eremiobacteraeota bacterium]|nr:hypothetical protein [Candidatus Eremiobacteraeota bacterium]
MRLLPLLTTTAALAVVFWSNPAHGATPPPLPVVEATDATRAAKDVLLKLEQRNSSTMTGSIYMREIGRTRTMVRVQLDNPAGHPTVLGVVRGQDCQGNILSSRAAAIPLNPINSSQLSETIVNVPISELGSKDYLIAIQNATAREQAVEACARLNRPGP